MTPQEKANQLVNQFTMATPIGYHINDCKKLALIAANEVIDTLYEYHYDSESGAYDFWKEVRKEIDAI
jgi:hypothetical protein